MNFRGLSLSLDRPILMLESRSWAFARAFIAARTKTCLPRILSLVSSIATIFLSFLGTRETIP
jgi:hypothetical protein